MNIKSKLMDIKKAQFRIEHLTGLVRYRLIL